MRVLFTTAWYPNRKVAGDGIFVQKHARAIALTNDVAVLMVQTDVTVRGLRAEMCPQQPTADCPRLHELLVYVPKVRFEVPVITGLLRLFWLMWGYLRGYRYIRRVWWDGHRPDVCHVNVLTRAAGLPWLLFKLHHIPYIITEHWSRYGRAGAYPQSRLQLWLGRRFVRDAAYVCPVSLNLEQNMQHWGLSNPHYTRVSNVVDTDLFRVKGIKRISEEEKASVPSGCPSDDGSVVRLLHVSWMQDDSKNISGILRVMARLKERRHDFHLDFIGEGNDKEKLQRYAIELGLLSDADKPSDGDVVSFLPAMTGASLVEAMQQHDALVMFSNFENQPVSVLEALACGLPVIATHVGTIPAMLTHDRGITVQPKAEGDLLEVLDSFVTLRHQQAADTDAIERSERLAAQRHDYVASYHSPACIGRQFEALYHASLRTLSLVLFCLLMSVTRAWATSADIDTTHIADIPVIELTYDEDVFNPDTFIVGTFSYHDADTLMLQHCRLRHRGGTSLSYAKPNYAIKFINEEGESKDVRFFGLRKDNNWILDAMASDFGKMRNRVSMDLWLAFSRAPYHQSEEKNAINGYRGQYVEVYANGTYMGLYNMMERLDRKQLKVKKFTTDSITGAQHYRGLIYKAVSSYSRTPFFLWQSWKPDDTSPNYDGMQCEYPDVSAGEPWSWGPLRNNIYYLAALSGDSFNQRVGGFFDLPVFMDYVLFIDLLQATDNVGKNFYVWFYDRSGSDLRASITPWDLDATWGRNYMGSRTDAGTAMGNKSYFHTYMDEKFYGYADSLALRYASLRDSLWSEDCLVARFDSCFNLLERTGAWERELNRWQGSNCKLRSLAEEQQYIAAWIHDRLEYLDECYGYDPSSAAVTDVRDDADKATPTYDIYGYRLPSSASQGLMIKGHRLVIIKDN